MILPWQEPRCAEQAVNKVHPYRELEREYITTDISIRELCRRHGISSHSLVVVQAQKGRWQEKRAQYRAQESDAYIARHAARHADRQAQIRDKALEAIDEAIAKFREDLRATEQKLVDGEWVELPVMRLTPRDLSHALRQPEQG